MGKETGSSAGPVEHHYVLIYYLCLPMQDKYKEVAVVLIAGMIVFIVLAAAFVFILLFYQRKRFFHMKQLSGAEQKYMEQLFRAQLEIQEQTLKKISLEIHDNIGQVLSLAKLQLGTIDVSDTGALKDRINDSRQLVARAIKDLRDLSHTLDADQVSHIGLLRALEAEIEQIRKAGLYQEALHNILKHAGASAITLSFGFSKEGIDLKIIDDGKGFPLSLPLHDTNENSTFGAGIRNMHNRANLIGATFQ